MASKEIDAKEWLRCNRCFRKMGNHQFFLTSCSHVFCDICLDHAKTRKECPQCQHNDIRTVPILDALKADQLKHCFESIEEPFEKMQHAFMFQKRQLLLNSTRLHDVEKKCLNYKEHCHRFLKQTKTIKEDNANLLSRLNELTKENQKLTKEIQELKAKKSETVAYMIMPSDSHSPGPTQKFGQNARVNTSRFQHHIISPRNLENPFQNPRPPIRVLTQQDAEFLVPVSSRISRSLGSSNRSSSSSSSRISFINYKPNSRY